MLQWLQRVVARPSAASRTAGESVVGRDEFRRIVQRERARSDRGGGSLSLILLDGGGDRRLEDELDSWAAAVAELVRCTDAVGWYDARTLGVVLAETDHEGALLVIRKLRAGLPAEASKARWRIFVHPEHTRGVDSRRTGGPGTESDDPLNLLRAPARGPETGPAQPARSDARRHAAGAGSVAANAGPNAAATLVRARQIDSGDGLGAIPARRGHTSLRFTPALPRIEAQPLQSLLLVRPSRLKRCVDVIGAGVALALLSPVMLAAALAVKLSSPGPVLFRQQRAGLGGRAFTFYKFRSMCVDAEARKQALLDKNEQTGPVFKIAADPRITPIGRLLRRTSIDELPQLWNVLRGDMSLVGPRPPILAEVQSYEHWQRRRLEITGGLTCIWQVSGRSSILFNDWVRLDLRYVQQSSAWTDLRLLARTIPAVLTCRGAH